MDTYIMKNAVEKTINGSTSTVQYLNIEGGNEALLAQNSTIIFEKINEFLL